MLSFNCERTERKLSKCQFLEPSPSSLDKASAEYDMPSKSGFISLQRELNAEYCSNQFDPFNLNRMDRNWFKCMVL
jgi:hypothetical protein